jgi:hypothetical protein
MAFDEKLADRIRKALGKTKITITEFLFVKNGTFLSMLGNL